MQSVTGSGWVSDINQIVNIIVMIIYVCVCGGCHGYIILYMRVVAVEWM